MESEQPGKKAYWLIYRIINRSQQEIYYGVTSRDFRDRLTEHARGQTEALGHWRWESDIIEPSVVADDIDSQTAASAVAHMLERDQKPPGFTVLQTAGV